MIQTIRSYTRYMRAVLWRHHKRSIILSLIATILFGCIIATLNYFFYDTGFWNQFRFKQSVFNWFCEYTDPKKLIRQPMNTFTNIAYIVNSVYFFERGLNDIRKKSAYNLITAHPFYSFTLSAISFYTFCGSTFYHSSLIEVASNVDFSAVYSVSLFPLMYFTHRMFLFVAKIETNVLHKKGLIVLLTSFTIIYLMLTFVISMKHIHEIVLTFIILTGFFGFILEKADPGKTNKLYLALMVITITTAVVFFKFDIEKIWCIPDSYIQPHSIWHLCNGFAVFYFYLYIRSERYKPHNDQKVMHLKNQFLNK